MKREFSFIIAPIIALVLIILCLYNVGFKYLPSLIIAFATIQSALIAIYISKTKEYNDKQMQIANRKLILDHFISLIEKGMETIEKEIENYNLFCEDLRAGEFNRISLQTKSFLLLERVTDEISSELFQAITEDKSDDYKQSYIDIITHALDAQFLKKNTQSHYFKFIKDYNTQISNILCVQKDFNNYYRKTMNSNERAQFKNKLMAIIREYNKKQLDDLPMVSNVNLKVKELKKLRLEQPAGSEYFNDLSM